MSKERTVGRQREASGASEGFTLIELLVVIAIIGVLAALIIPLSGVATTKMRLARVQAELNNYVTGIENYKLEVGEYPPDNGKLRDFAPNNPEFRKALTRHPLYYELSGTIYTNRMFFTLAGNESITSTSVRNIFNRDGIRNSARHRADVPYKGFSFRESQIEELAYTETSNQDVELLAVPVPGPYLVDGQRRRFNPWFYDASSTNRNNRQSFDLWAEILVGGKTNIVGNWKN